MASHPMCQIMAKPVTTAKKAVTNPFALFLGISIGSYRSGGTACPRCFMAQNASNESTCGNTAKL